MEVIVIVNMLMTFSRLFRCNSMTQNPSAIRLFVVRNFYKEPIPVAWEKPKAGWTKLNFDGSLRGKTGKASIGGVFRNHNAEFLLGYAESIGKTTSTMAELVALRRGLELISDNRWRDVWLEGDAKALVDIIMKGRPVRSAEARRHIDDINAIVKELDNWMFTHIYREGNRAADKLAQMGHYLETPHVWRDMPPHEVLPIVNEDAKGKIVLRRR